MGVVSKREIYFMGKTFKKVVKVSAGGTFSIALPADVAAALHVKSAEGNTLDAAESKFNAALAEFNESSTTYKPVILYDIDTKNHWFNGIGICVAAGIYTESCTALPSGQERFDYVALDNKHNLPSGLRDNDLEPRWGNEAANKIDFTEERKLFFEKIYEAMKSLSEKLEDLGNDQSKLVEMADSGRLKLEM